MKRDTDARNRCPVWRFNEEGECHFYGGPGRVLIAMDDNNRLLDVFYFGLPGEAVDREPIANMRANFPGAALRYGEMACRMFYETEAAHWPEAVSHHHEAPGREHERER